MRRSRSKKEQLVDSVSAYDRIATEFPVLSAFRGEYLASIEELVISGLPPGAHSLLDVGAGDGRRASRIADGVGIERVILLEPSREMRKQWPTGAQGWAIRAEELFQKEDQFDVITCLWNVLGHIFPFEKRIEVLQNCGRLLSPEGLLFVDVNHRYNARQYGLVTTALRMLRDLVNPGLENGDVTVRWDVAGATYATAGHVFTDREFRRMVDSAGLAIENIFTVSYSTGKISWSKFGGNPLYILRRV